MEIAFRRDVCSWPGSVEAGTVSSSLVACLATLRPGILLAGPLGQLLHSHSYLNPVDKQHASILSFGTGNMAVEIARIHT
ncbi:hypothetical protein DPEC_G00311460 [Dallia pectoralis]|uniref:Uncharacterized protein n=1 Tax=Dallia pectoralis TaxID=75939 RepID=A0ACC2FBE2_DALPE|nr:hypothetical protein DPEC_G00311460 [Dallia pectoralis]